MNMTDDSRAALRRGVYFMLIAISIGSMVGRIMAVNSVDRLALEKRLEREGREDWRMARPFLSSNDRSRWATIRSLVEHGTYKIDEIVRQPNWDTIDAVKHDGFGREAPGADEGHLYSSKPPLLATILAGEYWIIHKLTGATLGDHPYAIGRFMLVTVNVIPMLVYFLLIGAIAEKFGATDWGKIFVVACAALGTFLSTFAIVLNNHLPAAVSTAAALYAVVRIVVDGERRLRFFAIAGFFAAFAATNELPALSVLGLMFALLLYYDWKATLLGFIPPALLVAAAFFGVNYLAHNTVVPPYAHRKPGDNWYVYKFRDGRGRERESYWSSIENKSPVDQGEPSAAVYALHVLVGHHGIFSLTPIWLLSAVGLGVWAVRGPRSHRELAAMIFIASAVCIAFYLTRPLEDRNYGGMSSGFRWMFWFAPLWLAAMIPTADAAGLRRWSRGLAYVLLGWSTMCAAYPTWNPFTHPILLDFFLWMNWVGLGAR